jgi:hypothetical protein
MLLCCLKARMRAFSLSTRGYGLDIKYLKSDNRYNYSFESESIPIRHLCLQNHYQSGAGQVKVLFNVPSFRRIGFRYHQSYLHRAARPNPRTSYRDRQIPRTDARACNWLLRQLAVRTPTIRCNDSSNVQPGWWKGNARRAGWCGHS